MKLLDWRDRGDELSVSRNPMAVLAQALLTVPATVHDMTARGWWQLEAVDELYKKGYSQEEGRRLFHFIDWVVELPAALARRFEQTVINNVRTRKMPYTSRLLSVPVFGRARGKA